MQYMIKLPEDDDLRAEGRFITLGRLPNGEQAVGVLLTENQFVDGRWVQKGQPLKLTPLAVLLDSQNTLVYSPRQHSAELDEGFRLWLAMHPEWPGEVGQVSQSTEAVVE